MSDSELSECFSTSEKRINIRMQGWPQEARDTDHQYIEDSESLVYIPISIFWEENYIQDDLLWDIHHTDIILIKHFALNFLFDTIGYHNKNKKEYSHHKIEGI